MVWWPRCSTDGVLERKLDRPVRLKQDAKRGPAKNAQDARREAELARLRAVIAEITAENLELKKKI